jgi:flagellar biosynthesis chaperone FliJ
VLRTELDRKELELQNMQATCERYQARVAQLSKEYDDLETKLEVCVSVADKGVLLSL